MQRFQFLILVWIALTSHVTCLNLWKGHHKHIKFTHMKALDRNEDVLLKWAYNSTYIVFSLKVRTEGWMGFGTSPTGSMAGSDVTVMWLNEGEVIAKDMHALRNGLPTLDESQDIDVYHGSQHGGHTTVTFGRKLSTACDGEDNELKQGTVRLIYAFGDNIPEYDELTYADKHSHDKRGSRSIQLFSKQRQHDTHLSKSTKHFEIRQPNVTIPGKDTYYHCSLTRLDDLKNRKHHLVQLEPAIEDDHHSFVHHMVITQCDYVNSQARALRDAECGNGKHNTELMMEIIKNCSSPVFTWAIGGEDFRYPEDVGFPISNGNRDVYFLIETHYDNSMKKKGITDSSGMRFYYTSDLRSIEAGSLGVGEVVTPTQFIPAGAKSWRKFHSCSIDCLESGFPDNVTSIKIIAVLLHSHLYGVRLKMHHYRNGIELPPIFADDFYDFNYQEYHHFETPYEFRRGDEIAMECVYDTSNRSEPVYTGLGTNEEMCFGLIQYYPRIGVKYCTSKTNLKDVHKVLNMSSKPIADNSTVWMSEYREAVAKGDFDINLLNDDIHKSDMRHKCIRETEVVWRDAPRKTYQPYVEKEMTCPSSSSRLHLQGMFLQVICIIFTISSLLPFVAL